MKESPVRHIENSGPLSPCPKPCQGRIRMDWLDDTSHTWYLTFLARDRLLKTQELIGIGIEKRLFDFP